MLGLVLRQPQEELNVVAGKEALLVGTLLLRWHGQSGCSLLPPALLALPGVQQFANSSGKLATQRSASARTSSSESAEDRSGTTAKLARAPRSRAPAPLPPLLLLLPPLLLLLAAS